MDISVDAQRFAKSYFHNKPAPFEKSQSNSSSVPSKRAKNAKVSQKLDELELLKCCYQLLRSDTSYFRELWHWSGFIATYSHLETPSPMIQLYCNYIMTMLTNMSPTQRNAQNAKISTEAQLRFEREKELSWAVARQAEGCCYSPEDETPEQMMSLSLNQSVTNIEGVLLPTFNKKNQEFYASTDGCYDRIVKVDSTVVNLRSIALVVAPAKPICLSGPVGCGKTTLARKTGRICPKPKETETREKALRKAEEEDKLLTPKKRKKGERKEAETGGGPSHRPGIAGSG
ncbi:midasin-like isoform X1 [Drosophila miranda]|uniref:midasin-like isoform X1 n=1 Tax=Drosophila miranda TaxID=7229 RepID=UPI00143F30C6|nr:midasin-like isoform X1 [Drosophila miranda]XP_033252748.1 midasin-like isoform X1 [Drosophila miranda]